MSARIETVLGADWKSLLARALSCTPQRFDHSLIQPRVLAIIELLECVRSHEPTEMPECWEGRPRNDAMPNNLRERYGRLFGLRRLVPRLAHTLTMAQATVDGAFKARSPRSEYDLLAIVELLEALDGAGVDPKFLPERWRGISSAEEQQRSTRRPPTQETPDPLEMKGRLVAALGEQNASVRLAHALRKSPDALSRTWRSEIDSNGRPAKVQPYLIVIIELLETLRAEGVSLDRLPKRWHVAKRRPGRPRAGETQSIRPPTVPAEG